MELKDDALRYKFTAWMKVVVKRAKIDYLRRQKRHLSEISIEDEQLTNKLIYEPTNENESNGSFSFDDEILSAVFYKLPTKRRYVLELLFVHNFTPEEAAIEMHCSIQHVYNMRSLALLELRQKIEMEGK